MDNYFDSEIMRTEQELTSLKTAQQKFAGQVPLVKKSIGVNIPLSLNSAQTTASGNKLYRITVSRPSLFVTSLASYYDDVGKSEDYPRTTRVMTFVVGKVAQSQYLVNITAYGTQWGSSNDVNTLINGGIVTLTNTLTVQSTDDFTLEAV